MKPLVDIVIPVRNRVTLLLEAIDSVATQTFTDWRAIIVDDASDDGSLAAVRRLVRGNSRFVLVELNRRLGPQGARQAGFERSTAPLIATLDSDDVWHATKLERQLDRVENVRTSEQCVGVLCWYRWVDATNSERAAVRKPNPDSGIPTTNMSIPLLPRGALAQAGGFLPPGIRSLFTAECYEFFLRLDPFVRFEVVPECLVDCRHHQGGRASETYPDDDVRRAEELDYVLRLHRSREGECPQDIAWLRARLGARYLAAGNASRGFQNLSHAMRLARGRNRFRLLRRYGPYSLKRAIALGLGGESRAGP